MKRNAGIGAAILTAFALFSGGTSQAADEAAGANHPIVVMKTSLGDMQIELYPDKAPITVENFLKYVKDGHYKGTIFHRVMDGFMIQGGGFTPDLKQKTAKYPPIQLESRTGLKNDKYTIAMARTRDPNSATCQFFINVVDNRGLDYPNPDGHGYAVFGKVIQGTDVVDKIKAVQVTKKNDQFQNLPVEPVLINSVELLPPEAGSEKAEPGKKVGLTPAAKEKTEPAPASPDSVGKAPAPDAGQGKTEPEPQGAGSKDDPGR